MVRPLVKVCGMKDEQAAAQAAALGAAAIGVVFVGSSRRYVGPDQAQRISDAVGARAAVVGVFANHSLEEIVNVHRQVRLDGIQLHGQEAPDFCGELYRRLAVGKAAGDAWPQLTKALSVSDGFNGEIEKYRGSVDAFLLDNGGGGSGEVFDWRYAVQFRQRWPELRLIVAGGLDQSNVGALIKQVRPFGVDVSSGVEHMPGAKCMKKVTAFLNSVAVAAREL